MQLALQDLIMASKKAIETASSQLCVLQVSGGVGMRMGKVDEGECGGYENKCRCG